MLDASALQLIILPAGILAILFAIYLARDVLARDTGTKEMEDVAGTIFEGAVAFIRRQYFTIGVLAIVGAVVIGIIISVFESEAVADTPVFGVNLGIRTAFAFLVGAACSMASGIIGMFVAVNPTCARLRPPAAASSRPSRSRCAAARSPASSSSPSRCSASTGSSPLFGGLNPETVAQAPFLIVGFGFGASFVALFAQLGGGIYTKAADVGSDLVGKVEAGIPEDDPRNAGVIADLVGDNVGDCAGRGADLFESTAAENIGAMILGVSVYTLATAAGWPNPEAWIFFPLVVRAFGLLATIVAIFFVRGREDEDPMHMLNRGYWVTTALSVVGLAICTNVMMKHGHPDRRQRHPDLGLVLRRRRRRPGDERRLRLHHPVLHGGLVPPRQRDRRSVQDRPGDEHHRRHRGRLRDDPRHRHHHRHRPACQPLARRPGRPGQRRGRQRRRHLRDRRGHDGHAHDDGLHPGHGHLRPDHRQRRRHRRVQPGRDGAREITDRLDAVGNTTKALTKGYAIASASLAAFLLFSAYIDKVNLILGRQRKELMNAVNLADVKVFVAALIAAMLVYFFSSLAIRAVGTTAQSIIVEVRRQFREMPGHHGLHPAAGLRPRRRHHDAGGPPRDGRPGHRRRGHPDHSSACCSAPRRSPAC